MCVHGRKCKLENGGIGKTDVRMSMCDGTWKMSSCKRYMTTCGSGNDKIVGTHVQCIMQICVEMWDGRAKEERDKPAAASPNRKSLPPSSDNLHLCGVVSRNTNGFDIILTSFRKATFPVRSHCKRLQSHASPSASASKLARSFPIWKGGAGKFWLLRQKQIYISGVRGKRRWQTKKASSKCYSQQWTLLAVISCKKYENRNMRLTSSTRWMK